MVFGSRSFVGRMVKKVRMRRWLLFEVVNRLAGKNEGRVVCELLVVDMLLGLVENSLTCSNALGVMCLRVSCLKNLQ